MSTKDRKALVASRLSSSLRLFFPEAANQFLCPACLSWIPLSESSLISVAHLLPQAAGGQKTTLACVACNSAFGRKRDKWFGEYLQFMSHEQPTIFHARHQQGHFEVNGARVSGNYGVASSGTLEFVIREDRTSPAALQRALNGGTVTGALFPPGPMYERTMSVSVPEPPLMEHLGAVGLGFFTAAYLMWFREFGYSWALQRHLDIVRQQILADKWTVLPRTCANGGFSKRLWSKPWIGFGLINGELALLAGIDRRLVVLPPADRPDFYRNLPSESIQGAKFDFICKIHGYQHHAFEGPVAVMFDRRLVVVPDAFLKRHDCPILWVPSTGETSFMLYPDSNGVYKLGEDGVRFSVGSNLAPSAPETGRRQP